MGDPELTAVRRPFEAALLRMCQAGDVDLLRDELSNMLHHMYRLSELCRRRWGVNRWSGLNNRVVNVVPGALGAIWIRRYDTHHLFEVANIGEVCSDFYTELYGVLAWKPLASMGFVKEPDEDWALTRYQDYQGLENMAVLDTMRRAFDGLAALL
jgi:hypothetical protein